jgi:hypothetical protein
MYFSPVQDEGHPGVEGMFEKYTHSFHSFLNTLEKYQVEYDLGSERLIREFGKVEDGKFIIGERAYNLIVLPPLFENFENNTFDYINQYLEAGGSILSFDTLPSRLDGNASSLIVKVFQSYPDQWIVKDSIDKQLIKKYFSNESFRPVEPDKWGGRVYHMRRRLDDGQLLFFTNFDMDSTSEIHLEITGRSLIEMDPMDGSLKIFPSEPDENRLRISCTLYPSGSKLFFIPEEGLSLEIRRERNRSGQKSIQAGSLEIEPLSRNMLTLDYCDIYFDNRTYEGIYFYNAADSIFKYHLKEPYGFNYNPWSIAVQYRTNILDKNRFDSLSGFEAIFPFYIEEDFNPDTLAAVVEWPDLYQFKINGEIIFPAEGEWWLDRSFGVLDLTGRVRAGRNELIMKAKPMHILAELEPVYLLGDFRLNPVEKGWEIIRPEDLTLGSWKDQGFPFYSEQVAYSKIFTRDETLERYFLKLNNWNGTVAEVWINESKAGIIAWPPHELEISPWIKDGVNRVTVRVTGSLKNLLGPHHNNPRKGLVTPWSFFYAPDKQPAGNDYDLLDYGLFKDFEIVGSN